MGTGLYSSVIGLFFLIIISFLYSSLIGGREAKKLRLKVWFIVTVVYSISALIVSQSFDVNNFFMLSDPCRYLANAAGSQTLQYSIEELFVNSYLNLADDNGLYNLLIAYWGAFCNLKLDGTTSFAITQISVLFGILSAVTLFRILSNEFPSSKAFKYTIAFSLLSLFHFYSLVIVRDICISLFYLLSFEVVQKKFSIKGLVLLIIYMLLAWGFRLYSGLFMIAFIAYYIYKTIAKTKAKYIIIPFFIFIVGYFVISSMFVVEQSVEEIKLANEETLDRGGGLVMKLLTLPPVIKQIVMLFFTQIAPFPPTSSLMEASSVSQLYMSILVIIYEIWWFLIAYTMFYVLLGKRYITKIEFNDAILLLIAVTLIIATSSHPDIRRMMPVYPIIYYEYLKLKSTTFSPAWYRKTRKNLAIIYVGLLLVYTVLKF